MPEASRVEEEIKATYPKAEVLLIEGSGGVFDVTLDDKLIFSKLQRVATSTERFPHEGEIVKLIEKEKPGS